MQEAINKLKSDVEAVTAEAAAAWDAFDKFRKENGGTVLAEDSDKFKQAHELHRAYGEKAEAAEAKQRDLVAALEMAGSDPSAFKHYLSPDGKTKGSDAPIVNLREKAGHRFAESAAYKELVESGVLQVSGSSVRMNPVKTLDRAEVKALMKGLVTGASDTSGGALIQADRQAGIIDLPRNPRPVLGLITVGDTDSDTVEWVRQTARVNSAVEVPEATTTADAAADAPESGFDLDVETTAVREIKHMIPATRISLADAGQLRTLIEDELTEGLLDRLERQVLLGDGVGVNLLGMMTAGAGIPAIAANPSEPDVEAIHRALTQVALSNYVATGVLFNPLDWEGIRLAKDANGQYFYGPPSQAGARTIWGYDALISPNMPANSALAGNFARAATLWMREGAQTAVTDSHSDWFKRGILALLGYLRAAFAVQRPNALRRVTLNA